MNKEDCDLYFTIYIIGCSVSENGPFFALDIWILFYFTSWFWVLHYLTAGSMPLGFLNTILLVGKCYEKKGGWSMFQSSSVQFSLSVMSDSLRSHESQHARPPCPSLKLTYIKSVRPSSHLILCHPLLLLPPIPPSIRVFPTSQLVAWGGQSTGVSALASFLPKNTQDWSPLGWTGWISLQFKGLWRVFSNITAQKHQFFGVQPFSESNSHIHTWPQEKP